MNIKKKFSKFIQHANVTITLWEKCIINDKAFDLAYIRFEYEYCARSFHSNAKSLQINCTVLLEFAHM